MFFISSVPAVCPTHLIDHFDNFIGHYKLGFFYYRRFFIRLSLLLWIGSEVLLSTVNNFFFFQFFSHARKNKQTKQYDCKHLKFQARNTQNTCLNTSPQFLTRANEMRQTFRNTQFFEGVASKDPGGLIFLDRFLPHRTRSAHLLCTLSTTPLPVTPLGIATWGGGTGAPPRIHKTWQHCDGYPSVCPSRTLLSLEHVQDTLNVSWNLS